MEVKKSERRRPPRFDLIGGSVCLDFINTLDDRFSGKPKELLNDYIDLARFGEDTGILDPILVDRLFASSQQRPEEAKRVLASAIRMRETIYEVIWAVVMKKSVSRGALFLLNQYVQEAAQHLLLVETKKREVNDANKAGTDAPPSFEWRYDDMLADFSAPLWPIAHSAGDLLASGDLPFVRACAAQNCQWLFLDVSKNHKRVWCDMKKCGNRAKFRAYYKRQKKT